MNQLSSSQYRGILLGMLLLMLLGHWLFFVGYLISDDSLYLDQAERYLAGDFSLPASHWGFRYTLVVPLTLIGLVTDYNEWVLALFPLLYWVGTFWIMTWFMRQSFGFEHALYAGILVATLPLFVVQSSIAGVDIAEAFFLFAAFLSFYIVETSSQARYRGYFLAGMFVGLAMLTRETAYGFLLVLGVFFLWGGYRRWRCYLVGLAGVLTVLSLEWAYYLAFDQGLLYRLQTITESHGSIGIKTGDFSAGTGNVTDNRWLGPLLAVLLNQEFALIFWVAIGASVYLWRRGDPAHRQFLRYTAIVFFSYFVWVGYSGAIRPLPRYYSFLSLIAILPVALMLAELSRRWVRVLILLVLVGSSFVALSLENIHPRFAARAVSGFAMVNEGTVVTDELTAWQASGFLKLHGTTHHRVTDHIDGVGGDAPYTLAVVEGRPPPAHLEPFVSPDSLIVEQKPPKLLIGRLIDLSGMGRLLPPRLYDYLAIRNPTVHFYRLQIPAS